MSTNSQRCGSRAAAMLVASVVALAGTPAAAAPPATGDAAPTTAEQQANLESWEEDDAPADPATAPGSAPASVTDPAPAPAPIPTVAPPPTVTPAPVPAPVVVEPDPDLQRRRKTASGVAAAGATFLGLGGAAWVFLALPAWIAAEVAQQRAEDDPILVSENELFERAERRRRFARISFWSGLGGVVVGGTMLGIGLGTKSKVEREMSAPRPQARLHLLPALGRTHAGAALMLRY